MIEIETLDEIFADAIKTAIDKEVKILQDYKNWVKIEYKKIQKYEKEGRKIYICHYNPSHEKYIHLFKQKIEKYEFYYISEKNAIDYIDSFTVIIDQGDDGEFVHYNINTGVVTKADNTETTPIKIVENVEKVEKVYNKCKIPSIDEIVKRTNAKRDEKDLTFDIDKYNSYKSSIIKLINEAANSGQDFINVGDYILHIDPNQECSYSRNLKNDLIDAGYHILETASGRYSIQWHSKK